MPFPAKSAIAFLLVKQSLLISGTEHKTGTRILPSTSILQATDSGKCYVKEFPEKITSKCFENIAINITKIKK